MIELADDLGVGLTAPGAEVLPKSLYQSDEYLTRLRRRYRAEQRFRFYGIVAIGLASAMLVVLIGSIALKGYSAFWQARLTLEVSLEAQALDPAGTRNPADLEQANYAAVLRGALGSLFPDVASRSERRALNDLLSVGAEYELRRMVLENPNLIGTPVRIAVTVSDDVDQFLKGNVSCGTSFAERLGGMACRVPELERKLSDRQIGWIDRLTADGKLVQAFNTTLFTAGDSREPELAGVWGSVIGSLLTLAVCLSLAVPIGVAAAVYLEEFAPKNRWTDLIEVNINNLAAVPSIVFGLLGLAVFLNFFGLPRSAPVVGGLVLALMTLPTVIIATRAALKAVPPSIREAALGIGASPLQVIVHHVLPLATPGVLTGTIIGMAHALGETAPLLMIGMVAFIVDVPQGFFDSATVLPVQIYMWADSPERAFTERTSAAILILLGFLIMMNGIAVYLRKRFERRW